MIPEIDSRTGEVIFPPIPQVTLTHTQYTPGINSRTGEIEFPPIKQDNDTTYGHNTAQMLDEINTNSINKPTILLSIGTNAADEHNFPHHIGDFYYSHDLIRQVVNNPNYIPTALALKRDEYVYGDSTFIHLNNPRSDNQRFLYEHDTQISFLLSKFFTSYPPIT